MPVRKKALHFSSEYCVKSDEKLLFQMESTIIVRQLGMKEVLMVEILKKNWFVVLIAVLLCGFAIFYVWDTAKDNIGGKSVDGKDVVASIDDYDLTADDLYGEMSKYATSQVYYRFRNAVIEQTVTEETDDMKSAAKQMETSLNSQAQSSASYYGSSAEDLISSMLENYGLGSDELYRFCMLAQKESVIQRNYVKEHYDDLMSDVENPMIISYLELSVSDVSALSDEEQQKVDAINKALEEGTSFAEVAGEYNESVYSTTNGFYGYIDENTASWISSASDVIPLDESVLNAALALSEGETSEWIQIDNTSDSSSSTSSSTSTGDTMVLVHVDIAGKDNIKNMDNDDAWTSLATSMIHVNDTLSSEILFDAAGKLEISFTDENMMNRLRQFAGLDPEE